mmetsp:Transcript_14793/g.29954  ORF Transcript_14793/g.29954 Transcript_14793/m.29954 type:complete len:201 (-) Transcript_14793:523-1125(-)
MSREEIPLRESVRDGAADDKADACAAQRGDEGAEEDRSAQDSDATPAGIGNGMRQRVEHEQCDKGELIVRVEAKYALRGVLRGGGERYVGRTPCILEEGAGNHQQQPEQVLIEEDGRGGEIILRGRRQLRGGPSPCLSPEQLGRGPAITDRGVTAQPLQPVLQRTHVEGARGEAAIGGKAECKAPRIEGLRGAAQHATHQ